MEQTPKLYEFTRQRTALLNHLIKVFQKLSTLGVTGAGTTGVATYLADSKIVLILPIMLLCLTFVSSMIVENLQWALQVSVIKDPIDDSSKNQNDHV